MIAWLSATGTKARGALREAAVQTQTAEVRALSRGRRERRRIGLQSETQRNALGTRARTSPPHPYPMQRRVLYTRVECAVQWAQ